MENVRVLCGRQTPFAFLPNFTPTPDVDLKSLVDLDLKTGMITNVPKEFDGKIPKEIEHLKIDWEKVEENKKKEKMKIPHWI